MADDTPYDDPGQQAEPAGADFVQALATVFTHLARVTESSQQRLTCFHSVQAPPLSIHRYLLRIARFFQCSHECFVLCLIYIDRIVMLHPEFPICGLNIHRLVVMSAMIAVKFFDDVYYNNAYYAVVAGMRTQEVNFLEAQFLRLIDWRLHVTPEEYGQYRNHVHMAVQGQFVLELGRIPVAASRNTDEEAMQTDQ